MKSCDLQIINDRCYYRLHQSSNDEFMKIIEYKSWLFKSWKTGYERKYFSFIYINREDEKVLWSYVGFAPILIRYLQSLNYLVNGKELFRAKEIVIGKTLYESWDFQSDAINTWIKNGCFGLIVIPTGGGKSFTACNIINRMRVKTIITVHTNDLLINAWLNTLVEQFGEDIKSKIGIIGGKLSKDDRKRMRLISDTSYEGNMKQDIVIATSQSLMNKLDKLANEKFGLLVTDECHHYSAEQFAKVASHIRAPYRLGLTATVNRPDGTSPLFYGLLGDIVYRIKIRELVNKGVLVEPIFNTIVVNDEIIQSDIASTKKKQLDLSRYVKQESASSIIKKDYILNLARTLVDEGKRFIMYTDFVEEKLNGIFVRDYYVNELNNSGIKVIGVSSDMSGTERQKIFLMLQNNEINGIIFGKLGAEGVNIPYVDSVIMNNATKSTILFPQRVGRAMRSVSDKSKVNAHIYEILLNTTLELRWNRDNFYEYQIEDYEKKIMKVN